MERHRAGSVRRRVHPVVPPGRRYRGDPGQCARLRRGTYRIRRGHRHDPRRTMNSCPVTVAWGLTGAVVVLVLSDAQVSRSCRASRAIEVMRGTFLAHGEGRLTAPPRAYSDLANGPMVFTAGAFDKFAHGVRIYDYDDSEQMVAVW